MQVRRGEEFSLRVVNELTEPTAVHWHGVRLTNAMDGAPPLTQAPIAPGESFDYRFRAAGRRHLLVSSRRDRSRMRRGSATAL